MSAIKGRGSLIKKTMNEERKVGNWNSEVRSTLF